MAQQRYQLAAAVVLAVLLAEPFGVARNPIWANWFRFTDDLELLALVGLTTIFYFALDLVRRAIAKG